MYHDFITFNIFLSIVAFSLNALCIILNDFSVLDHLNQIHYNPSAEYHQFITYFLVLNIIVFTIKFISTLFIPHDHNDSSSPSAIAICNYKKFIIINIIFLYFFLILSYIVDTVTVKAVIPLYFTFLMQSILFECCYYCVYIN